MKRVALAALCLALAGCGAETGGDGGCASGIVLHGEWYSGMSLPGPDPPAGRRVEGGIEPACNDAGQSEADRETRLREVRGVPREVAVYSGYDNTIYLNPGYFTELPDHPLHDSFYRGPDRPRRPERGAPCRFDGEVESTVSSLLVRSGTDQRYVAIDARTRIVGFDRAGLPHLERGDRVTIRAYGCDRGAMLARRIAPQP
jgi:hypothetical protein